MKPGRRDKGWKRNLHPRRWLPWVVGILMAFLLLDTAFPLPPPKAYSTQVQARDSSLLRFYLSTDDKWRMKVRLDEVPPELPAALVAKEDRWFWWHPGVNPFSIVRATAGNILQGETASGASTITMQVARMLEPKPRTLWGKVQEAFRAFQLEWHHSKTEILEMYMSYLPYGGNVEGVKAASQLYLDRPPAQLSLAQCVLLTVIPNRPNSLRPDLEPAAAKSARDKWLRHFQAQQLFPAAALTDALAEPVPTQRHAFDYQAPQFCESIRQKATEDRMVSTLDPRIQRLSQDLLGNHVRRLKPAGISNGAVLVVDNRTMQVLAYCGSADFEDKAAHGEVDGIRSLRSPGSTLKPFIYAMAFDQGLLTPKMRLLDVPREFTGFAPVNYDREFRGEVPADEALRNSLNLPAVRLLNRVGLQGFIQQMRKAGFQDIARDPGRLGLSLALGACGVTMEELVRAYAALANGGVLRSLRYLQSDPAEEGIRICSPEAAYMVTDILSGFQRPDLPALFLDRSKLPKVAWKTGTSFGRRDAWSIGYNPRYTIGVWMGNMNGSPVLEMSGGKTAVPLLLDLFGAVDYDADKQWFARPPRLRERVVCSETGLLPRGSCQARTRDFAIDGVSPTILCDRDRLVYTDSSGQIQYCTACLPVEGYVQRSYPVPSPELALWMHRAQMEFAHPPVHNPKCTGIFHEKGPNIHSPVKGQTYYVEQGQEILLQAAPDQETSMHYWFANGDFLGACGAGDKFFYAPHPGAQAITCMDDKGRQGMVRIAVAGIWE